MAVYPVDYLHHAIMPVNMNQVHNEMALYCSCLNISIILSDL